MNKKSMSRLATSLSSILVFLALLAGASPALASGGPLGLLKPPVAQIAPPVVTIMEIQGSEQFSALDGQEVETSGVVTLFTANNANFWLQDPSGDGNPATSDGIFVAGGGYPDSGPRPEVGDFIRIIAEVDEQQYGNALPLTRLRNVALIEVLSSSNPLPEPVRLQDLPNELITEGIDFWEPLEGMLVSVHSGHVVAPTTEYGEFALITPRDLWSGSGFSFSNSHLLIRSLGDERVDYNPERIVVDDSTLDEAIVVRPGDVVYNLVGAVDYTFSCYKLQPVSVGSVIDRPLPSVPVSERSRMEGNFAVTTYNVENLFDLVDNPDKEDEGSTPEPDELETQLTKLALAIELELRLPEIIVVQEVENTTILQELGNRVNAATGTNYVATSFETSDVRGIEVGFLWDDDRVDLLDAFQLTDDIVPGVSDAFGPDSPSPGREPLVGMFEYVNLLPILMGVAMVVSQKVTPAAGPSTNPQQKLMMTIMPVFFSFICYNMASGLNLYILTSTVLGMVQQKFVRVGEIELKEKKTPAAKKKQHFYTAAMARKRQMEKEAKKSKRKHK